MLGKFTALKKSLAAQTAKHLRALIIQRLHLEALGTGPKIVTSASKYDTIKYNAEN